MNTHPSSALPSIIAGYKKFREKYYVESKPYEDLVRDGQHPKVLMIACCDSRVDPAIVTACKPGELFVIRNVANLAPPCGVDQTLHATSAALEFGVNTLNVSDIIVLGHSHCSGIRALMEAPEIRTPTDFINQWMNIAKPAKDRVLKKFPQCSPDEKAHHCERESLLVSLDNLMTFPWIRERVEQKRLFLHGWYLNLESGEMEMVQTDTGRFQPLGATRG